MSFPARCLPVLLFHRILSLSASHSVLSFWAFSVFSFAFVPAVPELIQRGGSLWLPVSSFPVVVMARRRPAFLVPDCFAVDTLRCALLPCFPQSGFQFDCGHDDVCDGFLARDLLLMATGSFAGPPRPVLSMWPETVSPSYQLVQIVDVSHTATLPSFGLAGRACHTFLIRFS